MTPQIRSSRFRTGVVAVSALVVLAGCGAESDNMSGSNEPGKATAATGVVALDLTGVRLDVRRDPG